jgi:hypothetical protein
MKTTVTEYDFMEMFKRVRPDNFSYQGLQVLFDYLENFEEDTGEELELDVIALCCDFTEYANLGEFQRDYSSDYETIEYIEEETTVIRLNNGEGFIIQVF